MFYFISFRDPQRNLNLGVCQVETSSKELAINKSIALGINPGGEAKIYELDEKEPELELDRLYSKQEMLDLGFKTE